MLNAWNRMLCSAHVNRLEYCGIWPYNACASYALRGLEEPVRGMVCSLRTIPRRSDRYPPPGKLDVRGGSRTCGARQGGMFQCRERDARASTTARMCGWREGTEGFRLKAD